MDIKDSILKEITSELLPICDLTTDTPIVAKALEKPYLKFSTCPHILIGNIRDFSKSIYNAHISLLV